MPPRSSAASTSCHRPYHRGIERLIDSRAAPVIVAVHSFTPQFIARPPRPWQWVCSYAGDTRLAYPLIARLNAEPDLCVGDNQPYSGHLPGDALDRHGGAARPAPCAGRGPQRPDRKPPRTSAPGAMRLAPMLDAALRNAEV